MELFIHENSPFDAFFLFTYLLIKFFFHPIKLITDPLIKFIYMY